MTSTTAARPGRLEAIDLLRGLIIVIMALDHVRDFFGDIRVDPTDLDATTPALFFTRWVTHICAPVFFLLTGTGSWFSGRRRGSAALSRHLLVRGLWLVVLEVTVVRLALQFNLDYKVTIITVLWALGWSLVALSLLVRLPLPWIAGFGAAMVLGHNLLDGINAQMFGAWGPLWSFLHAPGLLLATPDHLVIVAYPVIPWIGVTALGYALGGWYERHQHDRVRVLWRAGMALIGAFLVLRALNVYGDPRPWSGQESGLLTLLSFLNTTKYPPSLLFLLMTLGPALCLLAWLEGRDRAWLRPLKVYGAVPLFFFLLHFYLIHALAVVASFLRFGEAGGMFQSPTPDRFPVTFPEGWDLGLPFVYLMWVVVVVATYPLCRWYARLKTERPSPWMSYL